MNLKMNSNNEIDFEGNLFPENEIEYWNSWVLEAL